MSNDKNKKRRARVMAVLTQDEKDALEKKAKAEDRSVSNLLRKWILDKLKSDDEDEEDENGNGNH